MSDKGVQHQILKQIPKGPRSWSAIHTWNTCKLQYWFKYGEKLADTKGLPAKFGSAFHDARFRYFDHTRQIGRDSDWEAMEKIAKETFHDARLPMEYWDEFRAMTRAYAEVRTFNPAMKIEHRFGVNRDGTTSTYDKCNGFRGVLDGLEVVGDTGTVIDCKTSQTMDLAWTQVEVYAAFMSLFYPEVKEWRLVYDFPRFRRITEKTVLASNLEAVREHVWSIFDRIEAERTFKAEPSEECLQCPYLGICDYRLKGVDAITSQESGREAIQEYFQLKARAEGLKRKLKKYVTTCGPVSTDQAKAAFYPKESKSADTPKLFEFLKKIGKDPIGLVNFPSESLKILMKDHSISDDLGNFITIESSPQFDIKKKKEEDDALEA